MMKVVQIHRRHGKRTVTGDGRPVQNDIKGRLRIHKIHGSAP
jgi:hypothetical protein